MPCPIPATKANGFAVKPQSATTFDHVLEAARSGDGWAFERLYKSLAQAITAFATVRGAEDPEGLTNDVFLKAFRALNTFEGGEPEFRSWVFSIARNALIDAHRLAARRPRISERDEIPETAVESAETAALHSMSTQNVADMLSCLSEDQREVIALRLVSDLTIKQVAAIVDKPITAVKALQRRGMRRLQKELGDKGSPEVT